MQKDKLVLTQRIMSNLARELPSSINRFISGNDIKHLQTGNLRNLKYSLESAKNILSNYVSKKRNPDKKVWGFYNFKGGTGKTSLCFQISTHLALCGFKVLVIDADPQGNLSASLGFDTTESYLTLYDVIINKISAEEAIREIFPGYSCLPSNIACSRFDMELIMRSRREEQFKIHLDFLKEKYDFILFDTNPYISFVVRNIVVFSEIIIIPCETQPYSINALRVLFEDMNSFFNTMQLHEPQFIIVPNKYEDRYGTAAEAMTVLRTNYQKNLIPDFAVRKSEDFNIAAREGMPLACIAKKNSIALHDTIELMYYLLDQSQMGKVI